MFHQSSGDEEFICVRIIEPSRGQIYEVFREEGKTIILRYNSYELNRKLQPFYLPSQMPYLFILIHCIS